MSNSTPLRRSSAFLAAAVIGLSGVAVAPVAVIAQENQAAAEQDQQPNVSEASLTWAVKDSFRRYISGPIARGGWTLEDVEDRDDAFVWSKGTGTFSGGEGTVSFPGSIHFEGHEGKLDMKIQNVRLKINGEKGTIVADVESKEFKGFDVEGEMKSFPDVEFATVDLSGLQVSEDSLSVEDAPVHLTEAGSPAFGGFYEPDEELAPLSFGAEVGEPSEEPTEEPSESPSEEPSEAPSEQPSAEPSEEPSEDPSESPSEEPSTSPSQPGEAPTSGSGEEQTAREVVSGDLDWGVRASFRKYISGPIARGEWTVEGVKDTGDGFSWSGATGQYDAQTRTGQISYPGSIHFTGHKGILDMKIQNVRLQIRDGQGLLVADVDSRRFVDTTTMGDMVSYPNVVLGEVDLSGATLTGDEISVSGAPVTLTERGAGAFGGFYKPGEALDPLSFTAVLGDTVAKEDLDEADNGPGDGTSVDLGGDEDGESSGSSSTGSDGSAGSGAAGSSNGSGSTGSGFSVGGSSGSTDPGAANPQCIPVTVTEVKDPKSSGSSEGSSQGSTGSSQGGSSSSAQGSVSAASMDWGLKRSFRNYISGGIAKGKWDLDGVGYSNGSYSWSNGTGTFENGKGSIAFPGSLHFTGHKGILDTKMSAFHLEIDGTSGKLMATVSSNDMDGNNKNYGDVVFATVDLSGMSTDGGKISVSGAKTTLTQTGADAFANFYEAGQELDPLSFSGSLGGGTSVQADDVQKIEGGSEKTSGEPEVVTKTVYQGPGCDDASLAHTGASNPAALAAGGLAVAGLGAGAVLYARRRTVQG